jgi:type II secretory pathway pseudopilin PulG
MKKSFTLIELMVTVVLGIILLNFISSFQFTFTNELNKLKTKEILSLYSFQAIELLTRGFKNEDDYIGGLISLKEYQNNKKLKKIYTTNDGIEIKNINKFLNIYDQYSDTIFTYRKINSDFSFSQVKDKNGNNGNKAPWIYLLESDISLDDNKYLKYQKLVYTK